MSTARTTRTSRFTTVGTISKTRGTGGELLIAHPETVAYDQLVGATVFLVPPSLADRGFTVESARETAEGLSIKVGGVSSRADAFDLVGRTVVASATDIAPARSVADELAGLIGWRVFDDELGELGELTDVLETAAHPILVVRCACGDALIPGVEEFVDVLDDETRTVHVHTIPGMVPGR